MKRFLTGLDWSGDPGMAIQKTSEDARFVVAMCTVSLDRHHELDSRLNQLRADLRISSEHVFKHLKSSERLRKLFFEAMSAMPVRVCCLVVQKNDWSDWYVHNTTGPERIRESVRDAVMLLPEAVVDRQKLLVDMHRGERAIVDAMRQDFRAALRGQGRLSFAKVTPRPDHRADAAVVQIADMFAGEVRRTGLMPKGCSGSRFTLHISGHEKPLA